MFFFELTAISSTKLWQAEQSERFPVLDLPGKINVGVKGCGRIFFTNQISLGQMAMLVAYRSLSSWEEVLRVDMPEWS